MSEEYNEQVIVDTAFGSVTTKRVIYFANKGWSSLGSREEIPLKQVVSVRYEIQRRIFWGLFLIVLGFIFLSVVKVIVLGVVIGRFMIPIGVIFLWGSPKVTVITSGGTQAPAIGFPWQRKEADSFASALRNQVVS